MALRAHKIKDINPVATFELDFNSPLSAILDDMGKFNAFDEASGVIELTGDDLKKMEELLKERTENYDEEEVETTRETIGKIRMQLESDFPFFEYVVYYCY